MAQHIAQLRHLRIAPRKVRLVATSLKGLPVNEAEARLLLMPQRAAEPILKLLRSAIAGAKAKDLNVERLYVHIVRVDQAPMLKRMMLRARGGSSGIQKKASHIILELGENPNQRPGRFSIAPKKKEKKSDEPKKRSSKKKADKPEAAPEKGGSSKKGVISRTFSRKAGSGE